VEPLSERGIPVEIAGGAGFFIVGVLSLAVIGLAARVLLTPLVALGAGTPLGWANTVLGLLPGTLRGVAVAALLVLFVLALPRELLLGDSLQGSTLAQPVANTGVNVLETGLAWAGIDLQTVGIPYSAPEAELPVLP
jgi:hypothetical protein